MVCLSSNKIPVSFQKIEVNGERAVVAGTDILCGAIATMWKSVQKLIKNARCSIVEALEAASLHPAQVQNTCFCGACGLKAKRKGLFFLVINRGQQFAICQPRHTVAPRLLLAGLVARVTSPL